MLAANYLYTSQTVLLWTMDLKVVGVTSYYQVEYLILQISSLASLTSDPGSVLSIILVPRMEFAFSFIFITYC